MNKLNYSDIFTALNDYADSTYKDRGSYSFACGAFQSMLATLVTDLPKHKQAEFVKILKHSSNQHKTV